MKIKFLALAALVLLLPSLFAQNQTFTFLAQYNGSGGEGDLNFTFISPEGLALADNGIIYVSDSSKTSVYALNASDFVVKRIGRSSISDTLSTPAGILWDGKSIYISDRSLGEVFYYVDGSGMSKTVPKTSLSGPVALALDGDVLWVLDKGYNHIIEYNMTRALGVETYLQEGMGIGRLKSPSDMFLYNNTWYIADTGNNRIEIYSKNFTYLKSIGTGAGGITLQAPKGVCADGNKIYVSDSGNDRIVVFDMDGQALDYFGKAGGGQYEFENPTVLRIKGGILYVLDSSNRRIVSYSINWSANAENTLHEILLANSTVEGYRQSIIGPLNMLNITYSPFDSPALIQAAYVQLESGESAKAISSKNAALSKLDARQAQDKQLIEANVLARVQDSEGKLKFYAGLKLEPGIGREVGNANSLANSVRDMLSKGDYYGAASGAIALGSKVQEIDLAYSTSLIQNNTAPQQTQTKEPSATSALISADSATLKIMLESLKQRAQTIDPSVNFENAQELIDTASQLNGLEAYEEAQSALGEARKNLESIEISLDAREIEVKAVQKNISDAWAIVNSSNNKEAADLLVQAQSALPQNPEQASQYVSQALQTAQGQLPSDGTQFVFIAIAIVFLGVIALGAIALYMINSRIREKRYDRIEKEILDKWEKDLQKRKKRGKK